MHIGQAQLLVGYRSIGPDSCRNGKSVLRIPLEETYSGTTSTRFHRRACRFRRPSHSSGSRHGTSGPNPRRLPRDESEEVQRQRWSGRWPPSSQRAVRHPPSPLRFHWPPVLVLAFNLFPLYSCRGAEVLHLRRRDVHGRPQRCPFGPPSLAFPVIFMACWFTQVLFLHAIIDHQYICGEWDNCVCGSVHVLGFRHADSYYF
jgi:hypothetical protein